MDFNLSTIFVSSIRSFYISFMKFNNIFYYVKAQPGMFAKLCRPIAIKPLKNFLSRTLTKSRSLIFNYKNAVFFIIFNFYFNLAIIFRLSFCCLKFSIPAIQRSFALPVKLFLACFRNGVIELISFKN